MISIKKFLSKDDEAERAVMQAVRLLVLGIAEHAGGGEADVTARFRQGVQEIADVLVDDIDPDQLLVHANAVVSALQDHHRRATRHRALQTTELQNMVKMLASTLAAVAAASGTQVMRLGEIEKQVVVASELNDVRTIKAKLSECLEDIRKESERQRKETGDIIQELSQGLEDARKSTMVVREVSASDAVTGLPLRPDAEAALAQAGRSATEAYAAVLVLDRLQTFNLRFGREVGDDVLVAFARMIKKQLGSSDQLFRWSGPTLVALLPRQSSLERVRGDVKRFVETKLEHTIETPSRSIMLPIAARWAVFPMMAAPRLMYQKIDAFATISGPRD